RRSGRSPLRASNSICVRPSSLGMFSRKRLLPAERFAPWTHRSSGFRSRCPVSPRNPATWLHATVAGCHSILSASVLLVKLERLWLAYDIAPASCRQRYIQQFPCMRPCSSTLLTAGKSLLLSDESTMWDHPTVAPIQPAQ